MLVMLAWAVDEPASVKTGFPFWQCLLRAMPTVFVGGLCHGVIQQHSPQTCGSCIFADRENLRALRPSVPLEEEHHMGKSDHDPRLGRYELLLEKCSDNQLVESFDALLSAVTAKLEEQTSLDVAPRRRATRDAAGRRRAPIEKRKRG
jgi:hypothetical protein